VSDLRKGRYASMRKMQGDRQSEREVNDLRRSEEASHYVKRKNRRLALNEAVLIEIEYWFRLTGESTNGSGRGVGYSGGGKGGNQKTVGR